MYAFVYNICTQKYKKNVYKKSMQRETWAAYMVNYINEATSGTTGVTGGEDELQL